MFKELEIMKAMNITIINSIMKKHMKYFCLVLLVLCTSASVWGAANIADGRYELVTDLSTLSSGDKILIAGQKGGHLWPMQPYSSGNKCSCYDYGTFNASSPTTTLDFSGAENVAEFTLSGSASGWSLYDGANYYYTDGAATSGQNYLKGSSNSGVANHLWTFSQPSSGSSVGQVVIQNTTNTYVPYMHLSTNSTPKMACYSGSSSSMYIYKRVAAVTLYDGANGTNKSTIAIGDYFPNDAVAVPGWAFVGSWATSADKDCEPDSPSYSTYDAGDQAAAGTYYAIYQGNAYGCNYGDYSCKPTPTYVLSLNNPSTGSGVNLVVPNVGCGPAGTTVTLTYTINEPGTSYQGATITRDDNSQAVSFTHDAEEQTVTFTLPTSDVTAEISFDCPDLTSMTVTINDIVPYFDGGVWKANVTWDAVSGATQYSIQVNDITGGSTFLPATAQAGTSRLLTGLTEGHTYRAIVQANNPCASGNHTPSATKDFTPECPTLEGTLVIAVDEVTSTSASISWSGVTTSAIQTTGGASTAITYDVKITQSGGADGGILNVTDVDYTEWSSTSLTTGATYTVQVTAKNVCGETQVANQTFKCKAYTDYQFTCADLEWSTPDGTAPIWITTTAGQVVRSQTKLHVRGTGLTPSQPLSFKIDDAAANDCSGTGSHDIFAIRLANYGAVTPDASGAIDADVYVFYNPTETADGLDLNEVGSSIVVTSPAGKVGTREYKSMSATLATVAINGRHLPSQFVIAARVGKTWYALPSDMASTTNPKPSEIAVNDINNPSIAYTAATNIYGLAGPTASNVSGGNGQYVRLTMSIDDGTLDPHAAPLFGSATGTRTIGKSGNSQASSDLSAGWWWSLTQTNTSITNPQDAKYTIKCANNTSTLSLRDNAGDPDWGLFASGVEQLRLIPASSVVPTEAYFVEWAQHGGVVEVDAQGIAATSVVAHLNGESSSAITLVQTKAGDDKNKNSKYNYTVNFGVGIDFADPESNGAMLTLEWKNGETVKAMSNIIVPKIVASNITINKTNYKNKSDWNTEVHVLPGKTVTVDPSAYDGSNVTIKELNIYPGATVVASTGTLIATTLVLRNGWSRAGEKTYDVARLYVTASTATLKATSVYADWYIDYDQYYPVAVPWNATVANFTYRYCSVEPSVGHDKNIRLRYYDGASRATNVQEGVGSGANWKLYGADGCASVPTTLTPSTGYAMTAKRPTGKAFSIIRMPLTLPSGEWSDGAWTTNGESGNISTTHKDQVSVTAYGVHEDSETHYAEGWNLIANPYMSIHQGSIAYTDGTTYINYVNIPDVDFKEYDQLATATAKLKPASAFLIQAPKDGTITFGTANRKPSAPSFRVEENPASTPEQQAYIVLNNEQSEDMMGILVSEKYTAEYEINADLEKLLSDGNSLRTYMRYNEMNMAYVAINEMLAKEWIPVNVRVPQSGEYTFSLHEASIAGELEGVYLIDYAADGRVTNLIEQDYTFVAEAGTIDGRFAINAIVGERSTPTDIDVVNGGGDLNSDKPFKFIYHDKVYIYHCGVIYDATGKRVREINK